MLLTWRPDALLHVFRSSIVREAVHASGKLDVGFGPARGDRRVATQPEFVYRRISRSAMRCCEGGCTMNYNTISAQRIAGALGAEIAGVDLSRPLSDEVIGEIRQALLDHQVIFFHDQHLTAEQHLAFGRRFGGLQIHDFVEPAEEDQHILEVRKEPQETRNFGGGWHTDVSYLERPSLGSAKFQPSVVTRCSPANISLMRRCPTA